MYSALSCARIGIKADFPQQVAFARQAGFPGIEFDLREVAAFGAEKARALLEEAGVRAAGCGIPVKCYAAEPEFQAQLEELPALVQVARAIGCDRMTTYILPFSDSLPFQENFVFHLARLRPIAQLLADNGCQFGLEYISARVWRQGRYDFVYTIDGLLGLAAAIGTGNVGMLLDCWHWYTAYETVEDITRLRVEDITYVHLNDAPAGVPREQLKGNVRHLPGETGVIDLAGFMGALKQVSYRGPLVVEALTMATVGSIGPGSAEPEGQKLLRLPPEQNLQRTAEALGRVQGLGSRV